MDLNVVRGKTKEEVFNTLEASEEGLTSKEAKRRRLKYGSNQLVFYRARSPFLILLEEFRALFPLLLLISALLAFFANSLAPGEGYNFIGVALLGVVVLNALVSFFQNYKVEKLMLSFLDYIPKEVALLRDGKKSFLNADEIVPGDILMVQEGDKISADGIVVSSSQLLVDESILTGESEPVDKSDYGISTDEGSIVYSGSTVMRGSAKILVTRTGRKTEIGSISELSQTVKKGLTPMQVELQHFVNKITYLALGIGFVFFIVGFLIGNTFWTNLIFAIGIIVANVPEGLLPTVTLTLTQASVKMNKENAVVKHILSVETLGSTTVICTDKTGTLTRNKLHVEKVYLDFNELKANDKEFFQKNTGSNAFKEIMALCNEALASKDKKGKTTFKGDPTEVAMAEFVERFGGYDNLRSRFEFLQSKPFSSEDRYMASMYSTKENTILMTVKGAPDTILERCTQVDAEGSLSPLSTEEQKKSVGRGGLICGQGNEGAGHGLQNSKFSRGRGQRPDLRGFCGND